MNKFLLLVNNYTFENLLGYGDHFECLDVDAIWDFLKQRVDNVKVHDQNVPVDCSFFLQSFVSGEEQKEEVSDLFENFLQEDFLLVF